MSLSQTIETRRLFERRPVIDAHLGADALSSMPQTDFDEADALESLSADHITGLHGLYRITVATKRN